MDSWKRLTLEHHGDNAQSKQFLVAVRCWISNYNRFLENMAPFSETRTSIKKVGSYSGEIIKYIELLKKELGRSVNPLTQIKLPRDFLAREIDSLEEKLLQVVSAGEAYSAKKSDNPYFKDARYKKKFFTTRLVGEIMKSYEKDFGMAATPTNQAFVDILEAIVEPLGISTSNTHRLIKGARVWIDRET